jgi:hypothetical protein
MLIQGRSNINLQREYGCTVLFIADHNDHPDVTKMLIEARCNINGQQKDGATPLYIAAQNGHAGVTNQLIEARCNLDLQAKDGSTPLHIAAKNGHADVTKQLIEGRCDIDVQTKAGATPNLDGITALHAADRMGHFAIAHLIRNTRQKIAKSVARQAEEDRLRLVALLAAVPQEDWCRTWAACRTIMLRRTSKSVKEQVDKMRLPAVVQRCRGWRHDVNHISSTCPSLIEKLEIVMNKLPLMTAWCRITKLEVGGLSDFPPYKTPETFAGMLQGVLGQSAGSLTHLDLDRNCLGSDGVRRLAGVLSRCTVLRYLRLSSNDLARAGAVALAGALTHCRALNHLDLRFKRY